MRIINRHPSRGLYVLLAALPFIALAVTYSIGSYQRLSINPADKILPSVTQMMNAMNELMFVQDKRTGDYLFWADTAISLWRLACGMGISIAISTASAATICFSLAQPGFANVTAPA